jgi:hypothetical protein
MMPPSDLAPAILTAAYEQVRAWATGQAAPGPRPAGLVAFLRRGMVGWLTLAPTWLAVTPGASRPTPPVATVAGTSAAVAVHDLVGVLAAMIAAGQQEEPA